ncbi:hypothetical protein [Salinicoccus sp. CNSTN-B1]
MLWQSPEQIEDLLCRLVSWESRSGTQGEIEFPFNLKKELSRLEYYMTNPGFITLHDAGKGRNALSALYKNSDAQKTIVLISHFDTVHTKEFGSNSQLAFVPEKLIKHFKERISDFPEDIQNDIQSDEYLFGRAPWI